MFLFFSSSCDQIVYRLGATIPNNKSQSTSESKTETKETSDDNNESTSPPKSQEETSKVESEPESDLGKN